MKANDVPSDLELQSVVDAYDQPFAIVDPSYRLVVINRAFEDAYGVERSAAVGSTCHSFVPTGNRPCPCARQGGDCPFPGVFAGEGARSVTNGYRDADGREHLVRIHAYPIRTRTGEVYLGELVEHDSVDGHVTVAEDQKSQGMVGSTPVFRELMGRLMAAARSPAPVLLHGETGTGKELAAAQIHRLSDRSGGPFQVLDCTTLSDALFESEVFGHERGAFTGSVGERQGLFELADGGTLFIDEIGEMPLGQQAKLLRVLENGEFRRVGGTRTRSADVRLVCATNRELRGAPWFRQDLYYRIACIAIALPSLRERRPDIEGRPSRQAPAPSGGGVPDCRPGRPSAGSEPPSAQRPSCPDRSGPETRCAAAEPGCVPAPRSRRH
jgi:two-component system, NtrC family, response regulator AtoC